MAKKKSSTNARAKGERAAAKTSDSGPAQRTGEAGDAASRQKADTETLTDAMRFNAAKKAEYGEQNALNPVKGDAYELPSDYVGASSLSERNASAKTGQPPEPGQPPAVGPLDAVRTDGTGAALTTNQGVPVSDNQNSLKAGLRGPALLKDFILREKITHFDHERIPERIVHARGSGAHGYFECYEALGNITAASLFAEAGKRTPVFVRFSTVQGERGSKDTARDVRGFAVKFYTDEGNWDLVGNNIPVFFIQDAMKFPDLVHAVKPEPHNAMPQAASAHDTFWDFVSLMPESTHMLMWLMSDRAIPRSYRMMQGFGVHTFRFVNSEGAATLVKFHWNPLLGTHQLAWEEAVKISGADPDFHRRDLWEAIEAGEYPQWELGVQLFTEEQADSFSFDVLDSTKIVPEELVPVRPIGRLMLDRNPDNFFTETEQVAFCTAHIVPGLDFTNDPLLAGRIHSYVDTQLTRLGGPNFHELPINAPIAPVANNQREGMHRQAIHRGRVAYEPNSLAGGCPFQAGPTGFVPFPDPIEGKELRGKPEKFAEHYQQARLFFQSQSQAEQAHIAAAFRFELSKVTVPAIRRRVVSMLANASSELARRVAEGLGMELPDPMPKVLEEAPEPEITDSPSLSMVARPGDGGVRTRKFALLVCEGVHAASLQAVQGALVEAGGVPRYVGSRIGLHDTDGEPIDADASLENEPGVLFDGMVFPAGEGVGEVLRSDARALDYLKEQYRHCKPLLFLGESRVLLDELGVEVEDVEEGELAPGVFAFASKDVEPAVTAFIEGAGKRYWERETDPPIV